MSNLKDMAYSKADLKERDSRNKISYDGEMSKDGPKYPYGTELSLEEEHLKKLGIDKMPKVGQKMAIHAHGVVTHTSAEDRQDGKKRRSVRIQMQKMSVEPHAGSARDAIDNALAEANG